MASISGTSSNLEDLLDNIKSFVTTDATLVSDSQNWEVLRERRNNLDYVESNLVSDSSSSIIYPTLERTCRHDSRFINTQNETYFYDTTTVGGTKYITYKLIEAREVTSVHLKAAAESYLDYTISGFELQYSDDGTTWTTDYTQSVTQNYWELETKIFNTGNTPGAHLYWRINIIDNTLGTDSRLAFTEILLLQSDNTVANQFGSEIIFKAPGLTGTENIYVGIRTHYNNSTDLYSLILNGYTGYDENEPSFFRQPGALPETISPYKYACPSIPCWDQSMPFWFCADGRSLRMTVKVSTSYQGGYLGLFTPRESSNEFPYPLAVGGSANSESETQYLKYNSDVAGRSQYWNPTISRSAPSLTSYSYPPVSSTLYTLDREGQWRAYYNNNVVAAARNPYGYELTGSFFVVLPSALKYNFARAYGPNELYILEPMTLFQIQSNAGVLGELEGVFYISGENNAPENTLTINGANYVIFNNLIDDQITSYYCMRMD